ncbi:hypothetical protein SLS56_009272, partial [Neofusicoccum ribis]
LLKKYSSELEEEAGESLQFLAARLIRWKARAVADLVKEKHVTRKDIEANDQSDLGHTVSIWKSRGNPIFEEEDSDEEDQTAIQEEILETLAPVKDFLLNGAAFENLITDFEIFVRSRPQNQQQLAVVEETDKDKSTEVFDLPQDCSLDCRSSFVEQLYTFVPLQTFLSRIGAAEPPLEPEKERICGKRLYDDYAELRMGALKDLREKLSLYEKPKGRRWLSA